MFEDHLVHTVEVRRRNGNTDRFGQPLEPQRTARADATYAGRLTLGNPQERFNERYHDLVGSTHTLFLPLGSDVVEADRITVFDESGNALVDFANVTGVTTPRAFAGPHHIEVKLDAQRAGTRTDVVVPRPPLPEGAVEPAAVAGLGYDRVFRDDFTTLDRTVWDDHIWYDLSPPTEWTDFQTTEGGLLHLRSRREWMTVDTPEFSHPFPNNTVTTLNKRHFQYGYFAARMKWTDGKGAWPGFWLLSSRHATNPDFPAVNSFCAANGLAPDQCYSGEIDVIEGLGGPSPHPEFGWAPTREVFYATIHRNSAGPVTYGVADEINSNREYVTGIDLTQDFHTYSALWTPTEVTWFLDGLQIVTTTPYLSLDQPMFMLLQMWTPGWEWPISEAPDTPDLLETQVDWVEVWQTPEQAALTP